MQLVNSIIRCASVGDQPDRRDDGNCERFDSLEKRFEKRNVEHGLRNGKLSTCTDLCFEAGDFTVEIGCIGICSDADCESSRRSGITSEIESAIEVCCDVS